MTVVPPRSASVPLPRRAWVLLPVAVLAAVLIGAAAFMPKAPPPKPWTLVLLKPAQCGPACKEAEAKVEALLADMGNFAADFSVRNETVSTGAAGEGIRLVLRDANGREVAVFASDIAPQRLAARLRILAQNRYELAGDATCMPVGVADAEDVNRTEWAAFPDKWQGGL